MTAFQDDFDTIHVFVASREGSFEQKHVDAWPDYCTNMQFGALVGMPALPSRFPRIDAKLVSPDNPGVQVCDFVLWATQRSRPHGLNPTGKSEWLRRLKLDLWAASGAKDSAQQALEGRLGTGVERYIIQPTDSPPPRKLQDLDDAERWALTRQIANDVHRAAAIARGSSKIGHLAGMLERASSACEIAHQMHTSELGEALSNLMEAFLLVCHTLPVFDVADGAAWARATEKRFLASAFMKREIPLWMPNAFSLRANDVAT
ncbi:hypothetical protein [Polyangium aurulentum]|uniref:hypothetical protein n=1 Tax=Polyangium aurulentum TaxID=2567896 RepID=UPI0010AE80C5|nr:hypothetical protein [Polyangium aurulentum]UQA56325.1 hypothetical protein E8A73_034165 [Polyangium aurulentum]